MKRSANTDTKGKRAVGYIRVSDESQTDGYSLDAQRHEITRWCQQRGNELVGFYSDEGVSAHSDRIEKRPKLMDLLGDARHGIFDITVVHTLDRWARNAGVQRQALQLLGECGVGFASVTEDFDFTTPSGKMMLTTMGAMAEFFSNQLGVHVKKAVRQRAIQGLPVGPVPFGYRTPLPGGVPELVEGESEAVLEVFERRANGDSTGTLANWLNVHGFKTRKDGIFTSHAVKDMLNCRFYLGRVQHNDDEHTAQHASLISEELYQRVQARKQHRGVVRSVQGPKGLLQGKVYCGNCGRGIQSDCHRYGGAMYRERHSHECATNGRSMMARTVDQQLEAILASVELPTDWQDRMAHLTVAESKGPDPRVRWTPKFGQVAKRESRS